MSIPIPLELCSDISLYPHGTKKAIMGEFFKEVRDVEEREALPGRLKVGEVYPYKDGRYMPYFKRSGVNLRDNNGLIHAKIDILSDEPSEDLAHRVGEYRVVEVCDPPRREK